ncbi:hypothetical protein BDV96DRAFT_594339 [Lophiotrema nucula]|uniref:F-box domain-containing protein n=1 Tax=Lophiotrema nucula TaxID=690887 RepID=A0A6A5ZPK6_9PLEO|nr:hypothetical protein BDV96DRAFT_594339 [Lophiotrema nucula]
MPAMAPSYSTPPDLLAEKPRDRASHHALAIPELLTLILTHLPFFDLLRCQRVSKHFRCTISSSPGLQNQLFLQPDWTFQSPIIFQALKFRGSLALYWGRLRDGAIKLGHVHVNPCLIKGLSQLSWGGRLASSGERGVEGIIKLGVEWSAFRVFIGKMKGEGEVQGSWRRMQVLRPPRRFVQVRLTRAAECRAALPVYALKGMEARVRNEDGVRVGDIARAVGGIDMDWEMLDEKEPLVELQLIFGDEEEQRRMEYGGGNDFTGQ